MALAVGLFNFLMFGTGFASSAAHYHLLPVAETFDERSLGPTVAYQSLSGCACPPRITSMPGPA
jgi:hypothetical protein